MSRIDCNGGTKRQKVSNDTTFIHDHIFDDLEDRIIGAIFQIGLTQSSPKAIIGLMPETKELTREHVKSHLQVLAL
jgi:SHAQKYF class myb-like DNA-binding protein